MKRAAEVLLLLLAVALPLVPSPVLGAAGLAVLALLWWLIFRPPLREASLAALALVLASLVLAAGSTAAGRSPRSEEAWRQGLESSYRQIWESLEEQAQRALESLHPILEDGAVSASGGRQEIFRRLTDAVGRSFQGGDSAGDSMVLLNGRGEVVAWAGEGLLHELEPDRLPREGRTFRASFTAVTPLVVRSSGEGTGAWSLVAGRSFPAEELPFGTSRIDPENFRWSLVEKMGQAAPRAWKISLPDTPILVAEPTGRAGGGAERHLTWARRGASGLVALALLALVVLRWVAAALRRGVPQDLVTPEGNLPSGASEARPAAPAAWLVVLAHGGAAAAAMAATGTVLPAVSVVFGLLMVVVGLQGFGPPGLDRRFGLGAIALAGAAVVLLLTAAVWALQAFYLGPTDLGEEVWAPARGLCLRLGAWGTAFGCLLLAGRRREAPELPDGWAWGATGLLLLAGTFHDLPPVGLSFLALGGAAAALWSDPRTVRPGIGRLATLALLAALAAAAGWQTAYRLHLSEQLRDETLSRVAPPSDRQLADLEHRLADHFSSVELADLTPRTVAGLDPQDLAFLLWRRSPLARENALSALVVEPDDEIPYAFSFGLAVEDPSEGASLPPEMEGLPRWDGLEISGTAVLRDGSRRWGLLRYWMRPRPAFEVSAEPLDEEIAARLLGRGQPGGSSVEGLPGGARYALYSERDGRALLSPWEEAPPLPEVLTEGGTGRTSVATPAGPAWAFSRLGTDGWEVIYLPRLRPVAALERFGNQVVGTALVLAVIGLLSLLLALPRPAFRGLLVRIWRSYSRRLLIVFTLVLLVPLPLLNLALITGVKNRLWRQQRTAGEAALISAQRSLVDYLRNLPPGFGIDITFAEELRSLAGILRHDINFYWGSRESRIVSSRPELFAAGLVPKRIPGEVFSRLALGGFNLTSRQRSVEGNRYVEIYAPLRLPGAEQTGFFLSIPLLAQQEEVEEELAHLRSQARLLTAALFAVLVAVSARLARGFSAPITDLVEGTRRIARGADSLGLAAPSDLELAELAEAVDEMAARIARGRRRLLREKQVVDRIVQHITSGVVSLDRKQRILMANEVAQELIGGSVGDSLEEVLASRERLAPVAEFLRQCGDATRQATVRLQDVDGLEREWSLVWVPVSGSGAPAALLVVEDATEVLRGQRLEAWAEMARIIAHEIKNPLTPIRLSAEHMREVRKNDPGHFDEVFERCNRNILRQVDELQQIAAEFSAYSSILQIDPKTGDLAAALRELVESYQAAPPPGVIVTFEADPPSILSRFDRRLLGRAVRNLLENALRANAGSGKVAVRVECREGRARISVTDTGPGVAEHLLGRIFDPYFSTHDTGTGLGLPIARRVAEEHGGTIAARNREAGGLEVVLEMPC